MEKETSGRGHYIVYMNIVVLTSVLLLLVWLTSPAKYVYTQSTALLSTYSRLSLDIHCTCF